ncbi:MAG: glycosyltransferase family 87 protein [Vicinamibacterales bacterium]
MTQATRLHPLTRGLLWVLICHVAVAFVLVLMGHDTVLQHAAGFVLARGHHDSWEPMRQALTYVRLAGTDPLYDVVFFQRGVIFTYPTTSLLFLEGVGAVTGQALAGDGPLNALSWLAVAATIVAATLLLRQSVRVHLPELQRGSASEQRLVWMLGASLTLLVYPVVKAFTLGQIQTIVTALVACAMLAWVRGRDGWAGVCVALACLVKPQIGLLVVWALLRRRWRFAGAWAMVVVPIGLCSVARYGVANQVDYVRQLSFITAHSWSYAPNQSVAGILNRALFIGQNLEWDTQYVPYNPWVYAGTVASSGLFVLTGLFAGLRGARADNHDLAPLAVAALCFTMASPVAWEHHYGVLAPALAWLAPMAAASANRVRMGAWLAVAYLAVASLLHPLDVFAATRVNVLQNNLFAGALLVSFLLLRAGRTSQ